MLVGVVVLLVLGVNAKRQVQTLASDALGMEVSVGGRMGIGFFPSFHITMENVQIRNDGSEVASAAQADLGIELFPLLHSEVRMDSVELKHVRMTIERQRDGKFNFETQTKLKRTVRSRIQRKYPCRTRRFSTRIDNPGKASRQTPAIWT